MKKILCTTPIILLLVSCGASDNKDRIMEKGEKYSVSHGDKVIKKSEDTLIQITHKDGKSTSTIELLDGNATITHPKQK